MAADSSLVLSADEVFGARDTDTKEFVECPEWGKVTVEVPNPRAGEAGQPATVKTTKAKGVFVRGLTLKERGIVRKMATEQVADPEAPGGKRDALDGEKLEAMMVVFSACDADGRPVFKRTDWEGLFERLGGPVNRIAKRSMELSGMILTERRLGE